MISAQLMGGFGNQLFIYSFCKMMAHKTNQDVILYFDSEDGRELEISRFKLDPRITVVREPFLSKLKRLPRAYLFWRKIIEHLPKGRIQNIAIRLANIYGVVFVPEGYTQLNYSALARCKKIIINGFFQSEKYFEGYEDEIKREFLADNLIDKIYAQQLAEKVLKIMRDNSICVHIRRGDYLKPQYKDKFLVCDEEYYKKAIEYIASRVKYDSLYVFSDSIEWVKEHYSFLQIYNPTYINNGGELAVLDDFLMMKECEHFVMSNSTLSWWVQYLSENDDKYVVAPSRWLNDKYGNKDIYQENWHTVQV